MKQFGLIGGMSWESTLLYYKIINEKISEYKGGFYSADCILHSINFNEIESSISVGDWEKSNLLLSNAAKQLENAGVEYIAICSNTMHKCIPAIKKEITIPIIHIVEATVNKMKEKNISTALLLGTRFTMEEKFNIIKFEENNINIIVPKLKDRQKIHDIIFNELCKGIIKKESKQEYVKIIEKYSSRSNMGVILGCTEIGLLINQKDTKAPIFDTTKIHAETIAEFAIQ